MNENTKITFSHLATIFFNIAIAFTLLSYAIIGTRLIWLFVIILLGAIYLFGVVISMGTILTNSSFNSFFSSSFNFLFDDFNGFAQYIHKFFPYFIGIAIAGMILSFVFSMFDIKDSKAKTRVIILCVFLVLSVLALIFISKVIGSGEGVFA